MDEFLSAPSASSGASKRDISKRARGDVAADRSRDCGSLLRGLYRADGCCGILAVVPYVAAIVLVSVAPPPVEARGGETLEYIATHRWLYLVEQVLWLAPGVLVMVMLFALAMALKDVDRSFAAIAGVIGVSSWALTLALATTGGGSPALIYLSDRYAEAATAEQRMAFATAAEGFIAETNTPSLVGVLTTIGVLLVSLVMLRDVAPKWTAYLGVATGILGIVSEALRPVIGAGYAVYGVPLLVWLAVVGWTLYRLGGSTGRERR